mgnify:CR=1 FL=1
MRKYCGKYRDYLWIVVLLATFWLLASVVQFGHESIIINFANVLPQIGFEISLAKIAFVSKPIERAVSEITAEQEFTTTESKAFETFREEVARHPTETPKSTGHTVLEVRTDRSGTSQSGLDTVQQKYKDTVMDIPRFDEVYDETFVQHISAEFGEDVAAAVLSNKYLAPTIKSVLLNKSAESIAERKQYVERLEAERRAILKWNDQLHSGEAILDELSYDQIHQYSFRRLSEFEQEVRCEIESCKKILEKRQNEIQTRGIRSGGYSNKVVLQEYVYEPLNVSYPVLSTTMEQIQSLTARLEYIDFERS